MSNIGSNVWIKFEIGFSEYIGRTVLINDEPLKVSFVDDVGNTGCMFFADIKNPRILTFKENPASKANRLLNEHIKTYVIPWKHKTSYT